MAHDELIISLSPNKLRVAAVRRGRLVQDEWSDLDPGQWKSLWDDGLVKLDQPLRQLLSRYSARSFPRATVIYQSPTLIQQVYTFELSQNDASDAGVAKIRESVGFKNPVGTQMLSHTKGDTESSTLLVYSEREEQLRALYAWINRCNLSAKSFVSKSTAILNTTAEIAIVANPDTAVFYLGTDVSVIAYATDSGLKIIRSAEIGCRTLMEGYWQLLKNSSPCGSQDENDGDHQDHMLNASTAHQAFEMLFEHGIPLNPSDAKGIELRSDILPVLAPVLQRLCIEIKQTLRFGLSGIDMPKNLMICGPGASIPHIGRAIAQHIDMHIKTDPSAEKSSSANSLGYDVASLEMILSSSCPDGLLPEIARNANTQRVLLRSLVAGVALATAALGGEYAKTAFAYQRTSQLMNADGHRMQAVNNFQSQCHDVVSMSSMISDVAELISDTVQSVPQWHGLLAKLADIQPDGIRIYELRGSVSNGNPTIQINGVAAAENEKHASAVLNRFVHTLESRQDVSSVTLGATSRVSMGDDQWGRQFSMTIDLDTNPLPHEQLILVDGKTNDWGTP